MIAEILSYIKTKYPTVSDTNRRLLVGQARYESGNFSSRFYKQGNNLFGILFVGQRQANGYLTRTSDGFKFAKYATWKDSVDDRMRLYRIKYPHLLGSDDINKILDTWLYDYLGRNADARTKSAYKAGVISLSPKINPPEDEKKNPKSGGLIIPVIAISLLWIILN